MKFEVILPGAILCLLCGYQAVYALVRLFGKKKDPSAPPRRFCRYGVLVAARNEEAVIGPLIESVRAQTYPAARIHVFVVADNCTDGTARAARAHGARVWERFDPTHVGKGYALRFLLQNIWADASCPRCDGYVILDADNLLHPDYIAAINRVFSNGARVVTGCRNAKNYGDNWLTAGYGLYFLRESDFMNRPRDMLGVPCVVSGTGFVVADRLLRECGGWQWVSLSEDTEFTADMAVRGEPIAYCAEAVLYDEQPGSFMTSLTQRARWIRGYLQMLRRYGPALLRTFTSTGRFACYELLINGLCTAACVLIGAGSAICRSLGAVWADPKALPALIGGAIMAGLLGGAVSYLTVLTQGALTLCAQWRQICCPNRKKLCYLLSYPLFMLSFAPAAVLAVWGRAKWKPIPHTAALSLGDLRLGGGKV